MKAEWFQECPRSRLEYVLAHLPRGPAWCLDVGNIGGVYSPHEEIRKHIESQGGTIVGGDLNLAAALEMGHRRQVIGDVVGLPFVEGVFDVVYVGQVLEHLWTPLSGLREMGRVLKPGGRLVLDTPHVYAVGRIARWMLRGKDSIGDSDHKLFYTPAILASLLAESGFEVQDMCTDRKLDVWRWRLPWVPRANWLGSHLLVTAIKA